MRRAITNRAAHVFLGLVVALGLASGCAVGPGGPTTGAPSPESSSVSVPGSPGGAPGETATPTSTTSPAGPAAELVVEIHVPLTPAPDRKKGEYAYPWIDDVEEYLAQLDGSEGETYDDGEELGEDYVFFLSGAPETDLIRLARRVSRIEGVPDGAYAVVDDASGDLGNGRRVELR